MSFGAIQALLDTTLNSAVDDTPVAWENIKFTPILDEPWVRPTLLSGTTTVLDLCANQVPSGSYRVDVFYPLGAGPGDALDLIDVITEEFRAAGVMSLLDTVLVIGAISQSQRLIDDAWMMMSLDIAWQAYEGAAEISGLRMTNWVSVDSSQIAQNGYAYLTTNNMARVEIELPISSKRGDGFRVAGYGNGGWRITQNAGQAIYMDASSTTPGAAGSLSSLTPRNAVELVCVLDNLEWQVLSSQGNLSIV